MSTLEVRATVLPYGFGLNPGSVPLPPRSRSGPTHSRSRFLLAVMYTKATCRGSRAAGGILFPPGKTGVTASCSAGNAVRGQRVNGKDSDHR